MSNERELQERLPGEAGRGPFCPSESQLAAFVEGRLSEEARATVEGHLADCADCLDAVAFLVRTEHLGPSPEVPAHLLDAVRGARDDASRGGRGQAYRWLAAAAGLILVVVSVRFGLIEPAEPPAGDDSGIEAVESEPEARSVRNQLLDRPSPTVLHPAEGQALPRSALTLTWESVDETLEYSVVVMNGAGDPVWEDRTGARSTTIPPDVVLAPGERYYIRVTAHLHSGLDVRAPAVAFEVTKE
jgi:hypothetical protein